MIKRATKWAILAVMVWTGHTQAQTEASLSEVGVSALVKGVVTAKSEVREITALAKGSPIYLYDIIETTPRSFVVINFSDGGKLTLRPESKFEIKEYSDIPGQEKETFTLIKGGLRAVTGAIGKAKPNEVTYGVRGSTIGIRGTEFVVKLCEECGFDQAGASKQSPANTTPNDINDELTLVKTDGSQQAVSREQLRSLLNGLYVSVIEGVVRLSRDDWYIDIGAGDACFDQLVDQSLDSEEDAEVNCFIRGDRLEELDPYLNGDEDGLLYWNGIGGDDFVEGSTICEIL